MEYTVVETVFEKTGNRTRVTFLTQEHQKKTSLLPDTIDSLKHQMGEVQIGKKGAVILSHGAVSVHMVYLGNGTWKMSDGRDSYTFNRFIFL